MKVQYIGQHMAQVEIEGFVFKMNETRDDIPDAVGEVILKNPLFVDENGRNKNFECGGCSVRTVETAKSTPAGAVSLRHEDGALRCGDCFEPAAAAATVQVAQAQAVSEIADITALAVSSASAATALSKLGAAGDPTSE